MYSDTSGSNFPSGIFRRGPRAAKMAALPVRRSRGSATLPGGNGGRGADGDGTPFLPQVHRGVLEAGRGGREGDGVRGS